MFLSKTNSIISLGRMIHPARIRAYTVVPFTPQRQPLNEQPNKQEELNAIHALYNNENQSLQEHHSNTVQSTYRSLSEDDQSTFSPSFNTVFDE
jgi:hypothetical protein